MDLAGIFVPLITPFTADDRVDTAALASLAHQVITDGAAGIVALGTTAEVGALSSDERAAVTAVCAEVAGERGVPLVVGVGGSATAAVARDLATVDAAAALTLVPPFVRPTADGVVEHFRVLAAASPVPLIVYNVPYRTGMTLPADVLLRIAEIPGVIGTKHSVGAVDPETVALLGRRPAGFAVMAGDDVLLAPLLAMGASGGILASAHVRTDQFVALWKSWRDGTPHQGLGHRLAALSAAMFAEPNPSVIKAMLHADGRIPTPAVRLPLLPASASALAAARLA